MKKNGIFILVLGLFLVLLGIYLNFKKDTTNNINPISREHCNNDICINNLNISKDVDTFNNIGADITLKSDNNISDYYFTLVFNVSDNSIRIPIYIDSLNVDDIFTLQWYFEEDILLDSNDYTIDEATSEEIDFINNSFDE